MDAPPGLHAFADLDGRRLAHWAQARAAELDLDLEPWREGVVEALQGLQSHVRAVAQALAADERPAA